MASTPSSGSLPPWSWVWPALAWLILAAGSLYAMPAYVAAGAAVVLMATVFAAVHHAEVVAHRIGEPFGTLVLAVAVTIIEVALIVSMMLADPQAKAGLARDTVFSAVMIVCNGIVGISLLVGGVRHHVQGFQIQGASAALAVLAPLTVLTLVLPNYTLSFPGPVFSPSQLVFSSIVSLTLYGAFIFVQTVRHRDYFLPEADHTTAEEHAAPPTRRQAAISLALLIVSLIAIVGLAKLLSTFVEAGISRLNAPSAAAGIFIAGLVLLPEGLAAVRAARANRLQNSLNLALGSALASIGLTIPVVAAVSLAIGLPLQLGLEPKDQLLLFLTIALGIITLGTGRTTVLQGIVHLVVFAAFVFFALVP